MFVFKANSSMSDCIICVIPFLLGLLQSILMFYIKFFATFEIKSDLFTSLHTVFKKFFSLCLFTRWL